jgi:hypothetical protein
MQCLSTKNTVGEGIGEGTHIFALFFSFFNAPNKGELEALISSP